MKIVITGGHITPALATIDALKRKRSDVEVHFFGRMNTREGDTAISAEYTIITEKGIPFYPLVTGRLQRHLTAHTLPSLFKIPKGLYQSYQYLKKIKPEMIVSFGGYVAVPVVVAGWLLGIPSVSHEQTLVPGLANQIISKFVKVLALSFEETKANYPGVRTVVTGNPIREEIFNQKKEFTFDKGSLPVLFVTGGNQGSHVINETIFELLPLLLDRMHVIHQTGNAQFFDDYGTARALRDQYSGQYSGRYFAFDYIGPSMIGDVMGYADVVVSRAGVNTLTELYALGKKAILIPIPKTSHNEQGRNAEFFSTSGLGTVIVQSELSGDRLMLEIMRLLEKVLSEEVIERARAYIHLDAADRLADLILSEL